MKTFSRILYLLCLAPICLSAQKYKGSLGPHNPHVDGKRVAAQWVNKGDLNLRWYPLGLLNLFDMNLTIGAEYGYGQNKSLILDGGYILASVLGNEDGSLRPASGFIVKTAHRWYYGKRRSESFLDAEATFKKSWYQSGDQWVGRGVVDGVPAYEELMPVNSDKDVFTAGVRMGSRLRFSQNSPVGLEWWWGLGVRYRHFYPNLPADAQFDNGDPWFFDPFNYSENWLPDLQLGLRLTWRTKPL